MLGAIIGDIAGSRFEFNNYKSKDFELFSKDCFVTDDSILTLAVAHAIIEAGEIGSLKLENEVANREYYSCLEKLVVKSMQEIARKYPDCGFGGGFRSWAFSKTPKPYNSYGNGAAMRISPAGWAGRTETEVRLLAEIISRITHNHPEGLKGAEAVALAIYMARNGAGKEAIRKRMEYFYSLDFTIDEIRAEYNFDVSCQGSVPQAIVAFLNSKSFEDVIRTAVSLGGDSDTVAAIAGSIGEAYYGVDSKFEKKALSYLDNKLLDIFTKWKAYLQKGPEKLLFRAAREEEIEELLKEGYQHWQKNRTLEEYIRDNRQEEAYGSRYILEKNGEVVSSCILLNLPAINGKNTYGIGSVLTASKHLHKGYAKVLLNQCIAGIEKMSDAYILLYSDIDPLFYKKLNFRILPKNLQKTNKSIGMVRCGDDQFEALKECSIDKIPSYF